MRGRMRHVCGGNFLQEVPPAPPSRTFKKGWGDGRAAGGTVRCCPRCYFGRWMLNTHPQGADCWDCGSMTWLRGIFLQEVPPPSPLQEPSKKGKMTGLLRSACGANSDHRPLRPPPRLHQCFPHFPCRCPPKWNSPRWMFDPTGGLHLSLCRFRVPPPAQPSRPEPLLRPVPHAIPQTLQP